MKNLELPWERPRETPRLGLPFLMLLSPPHGGDWGLFLKGEEHSEEECQFDTIIITFGPAFRLFAQQFVQAYPKLSNIKRTKSQNLNDSRLVLHLSLCNLLKPGVK